MKALSFICLIVPMLLASIPAAGQGLEHRQADSLLAVWRDANRVDTARFDALNLLLQRTYHTITPDSIVRAGEQLFYFASKQGLKSRMSIAKAATGNGYYLQGDLVRAKEYYAAALALNDQSRSALNGLSAVCMANGDMAQAIAFQSEALAIAETRRDTATMLALLNNIGSNHGFQGDHATALIYMERALALAVKSGDTLSIADALMNIGNANAQLGNAAKTMDAYERSMRIAERMGNRRQMAQLLQHMAVERNSRKEYEPALELGTHALGLVEEMSDSAQMAMVCMILGATHLGLGQPALAAQHGERALHIAQSIGYLDAISQAAGVLYEARRRRAMLPEHWPCMN
ncbi:MAG: tetratricopeptide repeat protein [Flavobacteriales bacterium]|nr:tetratricopeptide repeat protein [Flavobacteriales bacterium]